MAETACKVETVLGPVELSPAQIAILQWASNGKDNIEIALLMNIERPILVQRQMQKIMELTGTLSRTAAVAWALRNKVIT